MFGDASRWCACRARHERRRSAFVMPIFLERVGRLCNDSSTSEAGPGAVSPRPHTFLHVPSRRLAGVGGSGAVGGAGELGPRWQRIGRPCDEDRDGQAASGQWRSTSAIGTTTQLAW